MSDLGCSHLYLHAMLVELQFSNPAGFEIAFAVPARVFSCMRLVTGFDTYPLHANYLFNPQIADCKNARLP